MKKLLLGLSFLLILGACAAEAPQKDLSVSEEVEITDSRGTRTVSSNPKRVAIFGYDTLDTLDTVGIEAAGIEALGLPLSSLPAQYSEYADKSVNVGTLFEVSYDDLDLFEPDMIILAARSASLFDELSAAYPETDILDASLPGFDLTQMGQTIENLAAVFPQVADQLRANYELILNLNAQVAEKAAGHDAMFLLVNNNAISFYGPAGRYAMLYTVYGFDATDSNTEEGGNHGKAVSFEYVVEQNPSVLFLMDRGKGIGETGTIDEVLKNPLLAQTAAIQDGHVYELDASAWYITTGGLNACRQMLIDVNQYLSDIGQGIEIPEFS